MELVVWWTILLLLSLITILLGFMIQNRIPDCHGKSISEVQRLLTDKNMVLRNKVGSVRPPLDKFSLLGTISSIIKTDSPHTFDYMLYQLDVPASQPYTQSTQPFQINPSDQPVQPVKPIDPIQEQLLQLQEAQTKLQEEKKQLEYERSLEEQRILYQQRQQEEMRLQREEVMRMQQEEEMRMRQQQKQQVKHKNFNTYAKKSFLNYD